MNQVSKKNQIVASRLNKTTDGKYYLEVGEKPFLMGHVQNCGGQHLKGNKAEEPYSEPLPAEWLENCFEKTAALGYNTISFITKWNEIEPKKQGVYDWTIIDLYVEWANKYDMYIDIAWFGSNACGGTRLPGHGHGWACWVPEYLQDFDRYFGNSVNRYESNSEVKCPWLPDGGPHSADAEKLFMWERNAIRELFNHLAVKDTNCRTILFQVFNEPNCHSEWNSKKHIWLDLINKMGQTVKESDYVVATRVNMAKEVIDHEISALKYIDFVGCDPYMNNVTGIREAIYSGKSNIPYIAENYGNLRNTSSLVITAIIHGGYYHPWQLNDHWEDIGMYEKTEETYTGWTIGDIPPMRESGRDMSNLNAAMNKIGSVIAIARVGAITGFNIETDYPIEHYHGTSYISGELESGFICDDGSIGAVVNSEGYVYLISDTSSYVTYTFNKKPLLLSEGALDSNGQWVENRKPAITKNQDGFYCIEYKMKECIRLAF